MLPTDTHGRRILAADRCELLRNPPPTRRTTGNVRRRLAALLVAAAARLAPEAAPRPRISR